MILDQYKIIQAPFQDLEISMVVTNATGLGAVYVQVMSDMWNEESSISQLTTVSESHLPVAGARGAKQRVSVTSRRMGHLIW